MKYLPIAVMLFAASLLAQETQPGRQMPRRAAEFTELKAYLALSDSQVTQLSDLRKQLRETVSPLAAQATDKRRALGDLRKAGAADSTAMNQLKQDLAGLHKQAQDLAKQYGDNARALLNPDQQAKLQALEDASKLMAAIRGAEALNLIQGPGPFGGLLGGPGAMGPGMMGRRVRR